MVIQILTNNVNSVCYTTYAEIVYFRGLTGDGVMSGDRDLDFFGDDLWGPCRSGADVHAWIGMDLDYHYADLTKLFAKGFGVQVFTSDGLEYRAFYLCTAMSMDTLHCIVENGGSHSPSQHGSFDRQPIGGRTSNRSRQPIEFWRQRVQHTYIRRCRRKKLLEKLDW